MSGQFYFWAAGTQSQRTIPGLYRSLLFQTLSQYPELKEQVFPLQPARMRNSATQDDRLVKQLQSFNDTQIQDAFALLLDQIQYVSHKICFLINGFDEFEGNQPP